MTVTAGTTASTTFTVSCTATATTGTLTVTTTTTGSNLDLDGYTFTVTGAGQTATRAIATNGTSTFSGIPTGSYQVQLTPSSVAANCTVTSANPQTVNVPAGGTATTNFDVTCTTGTITISNTTTGSNLDPDGYAVIVTASDGTQEPATMATNGSVTGELPTGSYQVMLTPSSVAANCTVTSPNPQTANVPAGGMATVTFTVSCTGTATTGTLTVTTTTTGSNLDLDGYTITVTGPGGTASRPMATNGTSTFTNVPAGSYQVTLSGIAGNCSVTNANPQTVNVPAGGTATTNFAVTCTTGTITISNQTTGSNLDPDGYAVIVTASDGTQEPAHMATNGSVTGELSTGSYQVQLTPSSVAANCTLTSPNPQTANVPAGGTATVTFAVSCSASTP